MRILILREKKAGHIHQVEGLASVLAELAPTEELRLEVRPKWWAHAVVRNAILGDVDAADKGAVRWAVKAVYGIDPETLARPDVILGSGRPATALGIWLKHYFAARYIYSGHASGPRTEDIDVELVNSPRVGGEARSVLAPVPGVIDVSAFRSRKPIRMPADLAGAEVGLILGGKAHSHFFSLADWGNLPRLIAGMRTRYGVKWRVTNSRRTPEEVTPVLEGLLAQGEIAEFVDFRKAGLGSGNAIFGSDVLAITEDSLSMIAEGHAAGRPVIALRPEKTKRSEFCEVVAFQIGQGWLASVPMAKVDGEMFVRELLNLRVPATSAREEIKAKLAERLKALGLVGASSNPAAALAASAAP